MGHDLARRCSAAWDSALHRYRAMFPGKEFSAPFFIQYGPGNTQTVDGADKYLYSVSTDGYTYNGSYLRLARVPLDEVQRARDWQFYHGPVGGSDAALDEFADQRDARARRPSTGSASRPSSTCRA